MRISRFFVTLTLAFGLMFSLTAGLAPHTAPPAEARTKADSVKKNVKDIKKQTSNHRKKYKKRKVTHHNCLTRYAVKQAKAQAAKRKMYHQNLRPVLKNCKVKAVGENVAAGYKTGRSVQLAWMKSPGHRKNILNNRFNRMGVGVAKDKNGRLYYAVVFGQK